jgi:hypothetical protein
MPRLQSCGNLDGHPDIRVQIIEAEDGSKWIRLSKVDVQQSLGIWSGKADTDKDEINLLLNNLADNFISVDVDNKSRVREAISRTVTSFDYWSLGLPGPISEYLLYEFFDDANNCYSIQAIDDFLKLSDHGGDQVLFDKILSLVVSLKLPSTKDYGLAVMAAIDNSVIAFANGIVVGEKQTLDYDQLAMLAKLTFNCVNSDENWWKRIYANGRVLDSEVIKKAKAILKKIRKSEMVGSVQIFFP